MNASEPNEHLDRVLIGGREKREIVIFDYDPTWPLRFQQERERMQRVLGPTALGIEHIGSTAVPGLAAKPIIDVLVTVQDPDDESALRAALAPAGYELRVGEPGHRMFRTPQRDVHIHIWGQSDPEAERYLAFRDRLRSSSKDRAEYEQLKRALATREWSDMNEYADAKADLIAAIIARSKTP